jgi:hypothetical protein
MVNTRFFRLPALAFAVAVAASLSACSGDAPTAPAAPDVAPSFDGTVNSDGPVIGGGGGAAPTTNSTEQCPEGTLFDPLTQTCGPVLGGGGGKG